MCEKQIKKNMNDYGKANPLSLVMDKEKNPRKDYSKVEEIKAQLRETGRLQAPVDIIFSDEDERWHVYHGYQRMTAVLELIEEGIPFPFVDVHFVKGKSSLDEIIDHHRSNTHSPLTLYEEAQDYKVMMDKYGMRQSDIAKAVGKSVAAISRAMQLIDVPDSVNAAMISGEVSGRDVADLKRASKGDEKVFEKKVKDRVEQKKTKRADLPERKISKDHALILNVKAHLQSIDEMEEGLSGKVCAMLDLFHAMLDAGRVNDSYEVLIESDFLKFLE